MRRESKKVAAALSTFRKFFVAQKFRFKRSQLLHLIGQRRILFFVFKTAKKNSGIKTHKSDQSSQEASTALKIYRCRCPTKHFGRLSRAQGFLCSNVSKWHEYPLRGHLSSSCSSPILSKSVSLRNKTAGSAAVGKQAFYIPGWSLIGNGETLKKGIFYFFTGSKDGQIKKFKINLVAFLYSSILLCNCSYLIQAPRSYSSLTFPLPTLFSQRWKKCN